MEIRELEKSEYPAALRLAWKVFLEFEAPDYSREGVETFRKLMDDRKYMDEIRAYGAFDGAALVGMLATRCNGDHITLFFVEGAYHRRGIGKALFALAVRDNQSGKMTVNSSPYAVRIYPRLGFRPTGTEEVSEGIRFTHMELELLDVVDENGIPTAEVVPREKAHAEGIRHRTSHVWLVRSRGGKTQILLQKRCENKDSWPGCYDISSAGHIPAGVDFIPSALRELREETGGLADKLEYLGAYYGSAGFCDEKLALYFARLDSTGAADPDEDEFLTVERYPLADFEAMIARGEIADGKTLSAYALARAAGRI